MENWYFLHVDLVPLVSEASTLPSLPQPQPTFGVLKWRLPIAVFNLTGLLKTESTSWSSDVIGSSFSHSFLLNFLYLFIYFRHFEQTLQVLQRIDVKHCPSSILCRDTNSRPLAHESPPITTRPGLPPI